MIEFSNDEWNKLMKYISDKMEDILCEYCEPTNCGKNAMVHTPRGISLCEGRYCQSALDNYIESLEDDEIEQHFMDMINSKIF